MGGFFNKTNLGALKIGGVSSFWIDSFLGSQIIKKYVVFLCTYLTFAIKQTILLFEHVKRNIAMF